MLIGPVSGPSCPISAGWIVVDLEGEFVQCLSLAAALHTSLFCHISLYIILYIHCKDRVCVHAMLAAIPISLCLESNVYLHTLEPPELTHTHTYITQRPLQTVHNMR